MMTRLPHHCPCDVNSEGTLFPGDGPSPTLGHCPCVVSLHSQEGAYAVEREIMLFIGKPMGKSIKISYAVVNIPRKVEKLA